MQHSAGINQDFKHWHEQWFGTIFLLLIFGFPISTFISTFLGMQSNIISIATRGIQVLAVVAYTFFLIKHQAFIIRTPVFLCFLLFWILYIPRIIYDTTQFSWKLGIPAIQYYLFGLVMSFLVSIPLFVRAPVNIEKLEQRTFWILLALNVIGLYNSLKADELFLMRIGGNERLNPITSGFLAVWLVVLAIRHMALLKIRKPLEFIVFPVATVLGLANMVIASTKTVFLFLGIFLVALLIALLISRQWVKVLTLIMVLVMAIVGLLISGYGDFFMLIIYRFTEITADQSSTDRLLMLEGAWNQFSANPILGSFIEEFQLQMYPHNTVLEAFMALGIIGGVVYGVMFIYLFIKALRLFWLSRFQTISIIAVGYFMMANLSGTLAFGQELWYMMAILSVTPFNEFKNSGRISIQAKMSVSWLKQTEVHV